MIVRVDQFGLIDDAEGPVADHFGVCVGDLFGYLGATTASGNDGDDLRTVAFGSI